MMRQDDIRALHNRLRSRAGETMVETLISVLISALALLLLATAIGTSVNIVRNSRDKMNVLYQHESTAVAKVDDEGNDVGVDGSVTFDVPLQLDDEGKPKAISVKAYGNSSEGNAFYEVIS